ncbi:hypothetical protein, partial [Parageobacillus toebii]|uniref:hypothetical protein n=1 Tax=Parageobacillus toebii TaxID=153151 RepID=UPI001F2D9446
VRLDHLLSKDDKREYSGRGVLFSFEGTLPIPSNVLCLRLLVNSRKQDSSTQGSREADARQ